MVAAEDTAIISDVCLPRSACIGLRKPVAAPLARLGQMPDRNRPTHEEQSRFVFGPAAKPPARTPGLSEGDMQRRTSGQRSRLYW